MRKLLLILMVASFSALGQSGPNPSEQRDQMIALLTEIRDELQAINANGTTDNTQVLANLKVANGINTVMFSFAAIMSLYWICTRRWR